jgi:RNA polymerase sigma-70 factor (ECF subfamily)
VIVLLTMRGGGSRAGRKGPSSSVEPGFGASLLDEHWDRLFRIAYLITRNESEAEDLAQDAIEKALRAQKSFDRSRPIEPWLNRIAANAATDWLRAHRRLEIVEYDETWDLRASAEEDLADQIAEQALPEALVEALNKLSLEQRTVVVLRHVLDLTPAEVAERLGVPDATVRTRHHRALEQMRNALDDQEEARHG